MVGKEIDFGFGVKIKRGMKESKIAGGTVKTFEIVNVMETKSQIRKLGRDVQKQVDQSTPGGRRGREIKQTKFRKKPTD